MTKTIPLYRIIINKIEDKIIKGAYNIGDKLPTETEVAEEYGVSRITSKRAFDELERQGYINKIIGSGSYVASKRARIESRHDELTFNIIDLIIPFDSSLGRGIEIINGANDFLKEQNYFLRIQNAKQDRSIERDLIIESYNSNAKGTIYYPLHGKKNIDIIQAMIMNNHQMVFVDKYFNEVEVPAVVSDNFSGAKRATQHLINSGHKNIAFASNFAMESASSVGERFKGYCSTLQENSIKIMQNNFAFNLQEQITKNDIDFLKEYPSKQYSRYLREPITEFLKKRGNITAILAVNDYLAIEIMRVAIDMDISIPEELSIVGFDNIEISEHINVPLTTVNQNFYEMGQKAAEMLLAKINGEKVQDHKHMLPVELIKRDSVYNIKS